MKRVKFPTRSVHLGELLTVSIDRPGKEGENKVRTTRGVDFKEGKTVGLYV